MEKYIITNDKVYIARNIDNSIFTTNDINLAIRHNTKIKAENTLSTLPKSYKNLKFKVVEVDDNENSEEQDQVVFDEPISNINTEIDEIISTIENGFKRLAECKRTMGSKHSNIEKEICDIEHAAEFFNLNASEGFMIYKMLQNARKERRKIKDDILKLKIASNSPLSSWTEGKISQNINSRFESRTYEPRVLKELFDR